MKHPLEESVQRILKDGKDLRFALARSLRDSVKLDFDSSWPNPPSPNQITLAHGLAPHTLYRFRVVVDKSGAYDFLQTIDFRVSRGLLRKTLSSSDYRLFFGREISKFGNRFIFTYAELQHFFRYGERISLPKAISSLLKSVDKELFPQTERAPRTNERDLPSLFLCHASEDKPQVRELYEKLKEDGFKPWLDSEELLPGMDWDIEISKAIKSADFILVCLSNKALTKTGYVQKEIRSALDKVKEMPPGRIFIIPVRLEKCTVPKELSRWHWVDIFDQDGYGKLVQSLKMRPSL